MLLNTEDTSFHSDSLEERGRSVGISENTGYHMTFKILNSSINNIINVSNFRSDKDDKNANLRSNHIASLEAITTLRDGKFKVEDPNSTTTAEDSSSTSSSSRPMPAVNAQDLIGMTFILNKEGGQRLRNRVSKAIDNFEGDLVRDYSRMKFVCTISDETIEEISA